MKEAMKPLEQSIDNLNLIKADLDELNPRAVAAEVGYMRSSRIQAWRPKDAPGAKSNEPPMLLPDHLDVKVRGIEADFHRGIAKMRTGEEEALHAQRRLLAYITPEDAAALAEAEADGGTCCVCGRVIDKRGGERLLAGRCFADYEYRRRHDGTDAPQEVLDARLEAEVIAAAAVKVKGGRRR